MADTVETLTKTLDDLGGRAMLVEDAQAEIAPLAKSLAQLAERAESAGYTTLADAALDLSCAASTGDALRQGLLQLQKILEEKQAAAAGPPEAGTPASLGLDPELLNDFFLEARDHLTTVETEVLTLERDPDAKEAVHAIFRGFHTIKGLAGFLDLPAIQKVAHEVETLLDRVRNGQLVVTPEMVDVILAGSDYLKTDIVRLEAVLGGRTTDGPAPNHSLIARVNALMSGAPTPSAPALDKLTTEAAPVPDSNTEPFELPPFQEDSTPAPLKPAAIAFVQGSTEDIAERKAGELKVSETKTPDAKTPDAKAPDTKAPEAKAPEGKAPESRIVKVDTTKLDFLVDMVGELVIAQSMIRHDGELASVSNPQLQRNLAQLSRITGEVQKTAMSMRMVPIGQLFQKSVRLVRDLTRKSGKRAEVEIVGEDTELDRTIVDDLSDPLVHMIRNAADHGIEGPDDRVRAGKSPVAHIGLKAYHQAGHIVIEISDDGRGLMREKILKKAKERGLIQDGTNLHDKDVFNLIFEPGFSTADKITDISGRGVGMDVVRRQIQKMRGRIDIESQPNVGTTFFLKLPLTLAIIDGLVVGVGNERYIVPIFAVREIFRPQPDSVFTVENRNEMVLVRGNLMPVVRLYKRFSVTPKSHVITESVLVVAESGGRRFCLVVDDLIGKQEVVIKSLGEAFKGVVGVAGGAILGDGRVGLIVDMEGVFGEAAHA